MANQSGQIYGLTILSPILEGDTLDIGHATALRWYLASLPRDHTSPFAQVSSTHFARLVVMDDVVFVGAPAIEEHLKSRYLVFETNFDGDLDTYLTRMAREIPDFVDSVWKHCVGLSGSDGSSRVRRLHEEVPDRDHIFLRGRQQQDRAAELEGPAGSVSSLALHRAKPRQARGRNTEIVRHAVGTAGESACAATRRKGLRENSRGGSPL